MNDRYRFEPRRRARRRALQAIYQWEITGQEASEILRQFRAVQNMKGVDEDYLEKLLIGVTSSRAEIEEKLQPFLDRPLNQVDLMERVALRIGAFELINCPDLPWRVVLNECVDLAHRFGAEQGHAYVNAVLDKAAREWRAQETDVNSDS